MWVFNEKQFDNLKEEIELLKKTSYQTMCTVNEMTLLVEHQYDEATSLIGLGEETSIYERIELLTQALRDVELIIKNSVIVKKNCSYCGEPVYNSNSAESKLYHNSCDTSGRK